MGTKIFQTSLGSEFRVQGDTFSTEVCQVHGGYRVIMGTKIFQTSLGSEFRVTLSAPKFARYMGYIGLLWAQNGIKNAPGESSRFHLLSKRDSNPLFSLGLFGGGLGENLNF